LAVRAVFCDLDETLLSEGASTEAALQATAADACAWRGIAPDALAAAVLAACRRLWAAGPQAGYCRRIGIAASEGLWASFAVGEDPETAGLREFAPRYRRAAWREGLRAAAGPEDPDLCAVLAERFVCERSRRQAVFPEALAALAGVRAAGCALVLLTNGDRDLQRRKALATGLLPLFAHVVISGELGIGKPDPGIFQHALQLCRCEPAEAVMVGDSLGRDIAGGAAAGLRTVWIDRWGEGAPPAGSGSPWGVLPDLSGLPDLLRQDG